MGYIQIGYTRGFWCLSPLRVKVGLLSLLMFLSATLGWARERVAVVLRQMDQPHDSTITSVFLDENGDGIPDSRIGIFDTDWILTSIVLKDLLQRGVEVSFDDSGSERSGGMDYIESRNILTVDGRNILDIFPNSEYAFPYAAVARRAAQQEQERGR